MKGEDALVCEAFPGWSPCLIYPFRNHYGASGFGTPGVNMIKDGEKEGRDGVIQAQEVEERPQGEKRGRAAGPPGFRCSPPRKIQAGQEDQGAYANASNRAGKRAAPPSVEEEDMLSLRLP